MGKAVCIPRCVNWMMNRAWNLGANTSLGAPSPRPCGP